MVASEPALVASSAVEPPSYDYVLPAIRGVQAGHEFFVTMFPLRLVPKVFDFGRSSPPEQRAQRQLNRARVPGIARYMLENPTSYVFPALTASVDTPPAFAPVGCEGPEARLGTVRLPVGVRIAINDGQHRRAAIEQAIEENPSLANESIAVVLLHDRGLERSQQVFADLNRHGIRPTRSLGVLYEHRGDLALVTKVAVLGSHMLRDLTDCEAGIPSSRSRRLFTLSSFYSATRVLLSDMDGSVEQRGELARWFWSAVGEQLYEWAEVRNGFMSVAEVRRGFIHSHSLALSAIARVGNSLLRSRQTEAAMLGSLKRLAVIDWSRSNTALWEGRALVAGRVVMTRTNVLLTAGAIREALGLPLPPEEAQLARALKEGSDR